jgi:hypothetical protein
MFRFAVLSTALLLVALATAGCAAYPADLDVSLERPTDHGRFVGELPTR